MVFATQPCKLPFSCTKRPYISGCIAWKPAWKQAHISLMWHDYQALGWKKELTAYIWISEVWPISSTDGHQKTEKQNKHVLGKKKNKKWREREKWKNF